MKRIQRIIEQGEGEMLDFKKEVSNVHRIARSIVAFANHHGGTLLIGVEDDGTICGVKVEEERFMLEKAAGFYCSPAIDLQFHEWVIRGKIVLEVIVPEGIEKPYYAVDETGKDWVYVRHRDQNLLASKALVDVLKRKHSSRPALIQYTSKEKALLEYLQQHPRITRKEFCKLVNISTWRAQRILVNLASVGVIRLHDIEKPEFYTLG